MRLVYRRSFITIGAKSDVIVRTPYSDRQLTARMSLGNLRMSGEQATLLADGRTLATVAAERLSASNTGSSS